MGVICHTLCDGQKTDVQESHSLMGEAEVIAQKFSGALLMRRVVA